MSLRRMLCLLVPWFETPLPNTNNAVDPRSLMFKKNTYGKPEVDWENYNNCNNPPLHFNISHTHSLIACGVTVHVPVSLLFRQIAYIFFIQMQEAYVKALGKGFSAAPFNTFTIQSKSGTKGGYTLQLNKTSKIAVNSLERTKKCNREWKFSLLELADSHYAAICSEDDQASGGASMRVIVRKTIPFVEDELISESKLL